MIKVDVPQIKPPGYKRRKAVAWLFDRNHNRSVVMGCVLGILGLAGSYAIAAPFSPEPAFELAKGYALASAPLLLTAMAAMSYSIWARVRSAGTSLDLTTRRPSNKRSRSTHALSPDDVNAFTGPIAIIDPANAR
jgi:hypothetical protein